MPLRLLALKWLLLGVTVEAQMIGYAVPAANYFVDKASGSDSNSGRTPGSAFATCVHAMSTATTGQMVAISGGGDSGGRQNIMRESCIIPAANMALVGWNGMPTITGADIISTGAWSKTGGFANIYQATVTTDVASPGFAWPFENGVGMLMATSQAALDSAPGQYWVANNGNLTGSTYTLFIYPTGGGNPASNGYTYESNDRNEPVYSQFTRTLAANLISMHNYANNGSFEIGQNSQAFNITAKYGTKHNALMHGGSTYTGMTLVDSFYNGQSKILLVLNDNNPGGLPGTFINTTCSEAFETGSLCLYGHVNTSGTFGLVTATNTNSTGMVTNTIGGFTSTDMIVNGGTMSGSINAGSSNSNLIENLTVAAQIIIPFSEPVEISNVIASCNCTNGTILIAASITPSLNFHNNDCSNSKAFDGCIYVSGGTTLSSFTSQNNIFRAPVQTNHILGGGAANLPIGSTINGNTYHYPGAASWILYRGTTYDISVLSPTGWTAWQALGFDATGSRVTP